MTNQIVKIAKEGGDIKTDSDLDLLFNSGLNGFKVTKMGSEKITGKGTSSGFMMNFKKNIEHGSSEPVGAIVYGRDDKTSITWVELPFPYAVGGGYGLVFLSFEITSKNLVLIASIFGEDGKTYTVNADFRYYIFTNKISE